MPLLMRNPLTATTAVVFVAVLAVLAIVNRSPVPPSGAPASNPSVSSPQASSTPARIAGLEAVVEEGGATPQTFAALGGALLQRLRETGDPSLYSRAKMAFGEALQRDPRSLEATVGMGTLALARHDFIAALRHGRTARRAHARSFSPFAVLVDAEIELGRYGAAARTLQRMIDFKPGLSSYARVSYFHELHGDINRAIREMRLAISAAPGPGENRSYVQTLLGNLEFQRGRLGAAARSYRAALAAFPGYPAADVGLAHLDAARRRFGSAIERLRQVVERLPLPEYVIALAETERAAGRTAAARRDYDLVRAEAELLRANGVNTDVELAIFEANHGNAVRAVALGRRVWRAFPSVRSADAYSWALSAAGRDQEAYAMSREAMRLGSRDPSFLYHAGMIARRAGDLDAARDLLGRLVAQNPGFSPLYGPIARRTLERIQ
jgi:tetratricopeptide (TPR) repeat protein